MIEPPAKKPRTEEAEAPGTGTSSSSLGLLGVASKEKEIDAEPLSGPTIDGSVTFYTQDTTMNIMQSMIGNMLVPLTDGGLTYLYAGARANVGIKSGRYSFEFKILETMSFAEDPNSRARAPQPRTQLRVGVATEGSSLFLGETPDSVGFDSDGHFVHNKTKTACSQRYAADVVTVVLNLEQSSPNANTISLFKNGQRASPPQPLPENLKGKALFPIVTFKNVSILYNFGPSSLASLPFKCHTVAEALTSDAIRLPEPKGVHGEAIFPVCLPDEGTFDWLDMFLEKNPSYVELSDRAILQWAEKSGLTRPTGFNVRSSNDKPEMGFGIMHLDDHSIRRVLQSVAPLQGRNYVVMEVKSNLLKHDRKELVSKWASTSLKKKAVVMMKSPPAAFKKRTQELTLKQKQEAAKLKHQVKLAEDKRRRLMEKKAKELEKQQAKMARRAEKEKAMLAKKVELEKMRADAILSGLELTEEQTKEQDSQDQQILEAMMADSGSEDVVEEVPEEEPVEEEPPAVELTEEEMQRTFRKPQVPDLTSYALNTSFMKFSIPEHDEGFDEISFDWADEASSQQFLKEWKQQLKTTTRIEDIQPGKWFNTKWKDWQKTLLSWHAKANSYKALIAKQAQEKQARDAKRAALAAAKEKEANEKKAADASEGEKKAEAKTEGTLKEEVKEEVKEEIKEEEVKEEEDLQNEENEECGIDPAEFEDLDVFGVDDPMDIGKGQPLFSAFGFEDWTMMSLRFELHLLCHSFRKDVDDPDRIGIHAEHLAFYYNKYYKKTLNHKFYGVETIGELLDLLRDTVYINKKTQVVEAQLPEDLESSGIFIMLTEEARRDRVAKVDLGDESARLRLSQPNVAGAGIAGVVPPAPSVVRPPLALTLNASLSGMANPARPLASTAVNLAAMLAGARPGYPAAAATAPGVASAWTPTPGAGYRPPVRPAQPWTPTPGSAWRPQIAWRG